MGLPAFGCADWLSSASGAELDEVKPLPLTVQSSFKCVAAAAADTGPVSMSSADCCWSRRDAEREKAKDLLHQSQNDVHKEGPHI